MFIRLINVVIKRLIIDLLLALAENLMPLVVPVSPFPFEGLLVVVEVLL